MKNFLTVLILAASAVLLICCDGNAPSSYEGQFNDEIEFTFPSTPPSQEFPIHMGLVDQHMKERRIGFYSGGGGDGMTVTSTRVRIDSMKTKPKEIKESLIREGLLPADTSIEELN